MKIRCQWCNQEHDIPINIKHYETWMAGEGYIQEVASYLKPWEREMIISQTCDDCWKRMYGDDDCEVYFP